MPICREFVARIFVQEPVDQALGGASPRPGVGLVRDPPVRVAACSGPRVQDMFMRVDKGTMARLTGPGAARCTQAGGSARRRCGNGVEVGRLPS
jgi:hypothetical protein